MESRSREFKSFFKSLSLADLCRIGPLWSKNFRSGFGDFGMPICVFLIWEIRLCGHLENISRKASVRFSYLRNVSDSSSLTGENPDGNGSRIPLKMKSLGEMGFSHIAFLGDK